MKDKSNLEKLRERLANASKRISVRGPLAPDEKLPPMPGQDRSCYNLADLSREQFEWLAQNRPILNTPSVYALQIRRINDNFGGYHKPEKANGEWHFKLSSPLDRSYHYALEDAEDTLRNEISKKQDLRIHSATIYRMPLDRDQNSLEMGWWLYDAKGNLVDRSVCSAYHEENPEYVSGRYMGRTVADTRFKRGDIIEMITDESARLVIVTDPPFTVEEMWERYEESQLQWDCTMKCYLQHPFLPGVMSDHYYVMNPQGDDIDWFPQFISAPTYQIPEEARTELETTLRNWLESESED